MITNRLRIPWSPAEGWWTLVLVAFMTVTAAWAIDDAAWVLGRGDWTDFLTTAAILGVLAGFVGAKVGWNRWVAHIVGAVFAALIVPLLVGHSTRRPRVRPYRPGSISSSTACWRPARPATISSSSVSSYGRQGSSPPRPCSVIDGP